MVSLRYVVAPFAVVGSTVVAVAGGTEVAVVEAEPPVGRGLAGGPAAADSRARKVPSSVMVVIRGAGNTTVVFSSTPISTRLCRFRSCKARGGPS